MNREQAIAAKLSVEQFSGVETPLILEIVKATVAMLADVPPTAALEHAARVVCEEAEEDWDRLSAFEREVLIETQRKAQAPLVAEIKRLESIIETDRAAAPDLIFMRMLGAILLGQGRRIEVLASDVLEVSVPQRNVTYNITVEERQQQHMFIVRLVETRT
jgi:hypothetical protein